MDEYNREGRVDSGECEEAGKVEKIEKMETLPQDACGSGTEGASESSNEELLRKGALKSLENWYKLYWIPLCLIFPSLFVIPAGAILMKVGVTLQSNGLCISGIALMFIAGFVLVVSGIFVAVSSFVLLYRYWKFLPATEAVTTPAKAVGYLFLPFFNLYWVFVAYGKLGSIIDSLTENNKSRCKTICYVYAVFFTLVTIMGYFAQICMLTYPQWGGFMDFSGFFSFPAAVFSIVMMVNLQKAFRKYLKGPVSNWKNNPPYSITPLWAGISTGIFISVVLIIFHVLFIFFSDIGCYSDPENTEMETSVYSAPANISAPQKNK